MGLIVSLIRYGVEALKPAPSPSPVPQHEIQKGSPLSEIMVRKQNLDAVYHRLIPRLYRIILISFIVSCIDYYPAATTSDDWLEKFDYASASIGVATCIIALLCMHLQTFIGMLFVDVLIIARIVLYGVDIKHISDEGESSDNYIQPILFIIIKLLFLGLATLCTVVFFKYIEINREIAVMRKQQPAAEQEPINNNVVVTVRD